MGISHLHILLVTRGFAKSAGL